MRNRNTSHCQVLIGLPVDELQFCLMLLTRLKADDLIDEASRRRAIELLEPMWLLAREATNSQAWSSQGEMTEQ